jgi:hypothetical protein
MHNMRKVTTLLLLLLPALIKAQPAINSWILNTTGKKASFWATGTGMPPTYTFTNTTDSADALKVCYNADTVWVSSNSMTDNMGKWMNPGSAVAQHFTHRFPRNPVPATTKVVSPKLAEIGLLTNGIAIYGLSNANSWSGTANATPQAGGLGIWNVEVGKSEGFVLDTAFGAHPQQQGVYHSHTTPYRLYKFAASGQHSPLIGYAFDGYPIYGPYGYSSAMNASSVVTRMKSGYSLRNITTRTTLPYGVTASQTGPPVNATYPIGTYCEDWEWLASNGGDLDKYNGRMCVTPEYPAGTYAYFVTIDAAGAAAFPYYIGIEYYGQPDTKNFPNGPAGNGISVPSTGVTCLTAGATAVGTTSGSSGTMLLYPNPSSGHLILMSTGHSYTRIEVYNATAQLVHTAPVNGTSNHDMSLNTPGLYVVRCINEHNGATSSQRIVVQ